MYINGDEKVVGDEMKGMRCNEDLRNYMTGVVKL